MGFIYQEANAYGVEALVALERHYTPTEEKYCTAVTEAVRICDTYGIPERELVPQVRHIAAAEEYLLEHLSEDEETLQFLFTPLSGSNTCLAWFLVWDYVRPGGEKAYKYTGHTPQQRLRDIISAVGQYQEDPLPPPQQLDTICDLIDYMDLTRLPPADRWRLLTLYAHLEEYERTACRIVEQSAALLAQVMQTPETDRLLRQCLEQTRENTPRLMSAFAQSQTLSDQSITFLPCVMSFNSMRFLPGDDHITVIAGVLYWLILRLTEKYAANDEHLLACLKTLGDKSRLDILKLLKEQDRSGQELAKELDVDPATFANTMETWNSYVEAKNDPDFGRTSFANPLNNGPYYAIKVTAGVHHTMGGVTINSATEVLKEDGTVIPGLFAAGEVTGGVHGANRLGGTAVADFVVFGRIAGESAANYASAQ